MKNQLLILYINFEHDSMFVKRTFILFLVLALPFFAQGQFSETFKNGLGLESDFGYGFIMPHHKSIEYTIEEHVRPFDIKLTKATFGNKYWNQLYRYPYYGIGFYRSNLGNDHVYGYVNALYSFIKVPIFGSSDQANLSWQFAFGASYISKIFDINDNPQNLAIGSNLNIYIDFSLQSTIPLSKKLALTNSLRFTHVSNGKVKSPNKGLNAISPSMGLLYHFNHSPERKQLALPEIDPKNEYTLIFAGGIKTISRYEPGYYFASSLIFDYNRNYSLKRRWGLGADLFFDGSNRQFSSQTEKADIVNSDLYLVGLHLGHEMLIQRLSLVINLGAYLYAPVETPAPIYTRIGVRYRIKDKIITNLTLKSHWASASFIEWGLGYVF